jgi:hypothetical protein
VSAVFTLPSYIHRYIDGVSPLHDQSFPFYSKKKKEKKTTTRGGKKKKERENVLDIARNGNH